MQGMLEDADPPGPLVPLRSLFLRALRASGLAWDLTLVKPLSLGVLLPDPRQELLGGWQEGLPALLGAMFPAGRPCTAPAQHQAKDQPASLSLHPLLVPFHRDC